MFIDFLGLACYSGASRSLTLLSYRDLESAMRRPDERRQPYHAVAEQQILLLGIEIHHPNWRSRNPDERRTRVGLVCDWVDCCQLPGNGHAKRGHAHTLVGHLETILSGVGERGEACLLTDESYDRIAATARRLREDFGLSAMEADTADVSVNENLAQVLAEALPGPTEEEVDRLRADIDPDRDSDGRALSATAEELDGEDDLERARRLT